MQSSRILVVIPTFNEALNIDEVVSRVVAAGVEYDVLVVDDGSPDGTAAIAKQIALTTPRVRLLERHGKGGRGTAVLAGFGEGVTQGAYSHFVEMDADLSHAPEALPGLVAAADRFDVVIGSRYVPGGGVTGWGLHRRVWSASCNRIIDAVLGLSLADYTNGYRLYSASAVAALLAAPLRETGFISLSEWAVVLRRRGFTIGEVPVQFVDRLRGKSNMSAAEALHAARALVRLRRTAARR